MGGGPYAAMNAGLAQARGHYAHVLNADDLLLAPEAYAAWLRQGERQGAAVLIASIGYFRRPRRWLRSHGSCRHLRRTPGSGDSSCGGACTTPIRASWRKRPSTGRRASMSATTSRPTTS